MTTGINFWDTGVWSFLMTMTALFMAMMLANILRNTIRPLRRAMIPSSVLGGFLLLAAEGIYGRIFGKELMSGQILEMLTYHGLGLGFVAMSLRTIEKKKDKRSRTAGFDTGVTVVCGYLLQAIVGLAISLGLYYAIGSFPAAGMLLPMGYGQGPGQAFNWGKTFENTYGFVGGTSFGLTIAAMGFVSASVGGVIALNLLRKKGILRAPEERRIDSPESSEHVTAHDEIPVSDSMDKFTVQLALVFIAYSAAYLFMLGINAIIETGALGNFGYNTVRPLIWGFNFMFGTLFAMILKGCLRSLKKKGVIHREYANNFLQNRISGFMFDMMVVASIGAIDLSAFTEPKFILPLIGLCVAGGVVTFLYLRYLCPKVFPQYPVEAFMSLYGMLTGTASTGVILLREVDPRFHTQASDNLVTHLLWAIVFGFPMLLLLSVAPQSIGAAWITLGLLSVLFVAMHILVMRRSLFHRKTGK